MDSLRSFLEHLRSEWQTVRAAPFSFALLSLASGVAAYFLVDWFYRSALKAKNARIDQQASYISQLEARKPEAELEPLKATISTLREQLTDREETITALRSQLKEAIAKPAKQSAAIPTPGQPLSQPSVGDAYVLCESQRSMRDTVLGGHVRLAEGDADDVGKKNRHRGRNGFRGVGSRGLGIAIGQEAF